MPRRVRVRRRRRAGRPTSLSTRRGALLALLPLSLLCAGVVITRHASRARRGARRGGGGGGAAAAAGLPRARVVRQAQGGGTWEEAPASPALFGVQQEAGDPVDPAVLGKTGQTAEAIETGIRGQGGGPRTLDSNSIIFPASTARFQGGVYVLDFSQAKDGNPICLNTDDNICEVGPDAFSRAGYVYRVSLDDQVDVNRKASSLETQHTGLCVDSACRHIAEVRVVAIFDSEEGVRAKNASRHSCILRRRKGSNKFTGLAQSVLVASARKKTQVLNETANSRPGVGGSRFPDTVFPWEFQFSRPPLVWSATGYRGYFNAIMSDDFNALPREDLGNGEREVDFSLLDVPLDADETEWVTFANETEGAACAQTGNWALHAAAHQATTLDDTGRGVVDSTFVQPLPPRASGTELALSIGQALLGVATMYLLLGEVFLEITKLQDPSLSLRRKNGRALAGLICKWPVWIAWALGLVLLGLECIAIGVVYVGERNAMRTLGEFVDAHFVASIARDTGPNPFLINERGNFVVLSLIVGTARYTKSNERALAIVFPLVLLLGLLGVVLALWPILIFRWFAKREVAKNDAKRSARVDVTDFDVEQDVESGGDICANGNEGTKATSPDVDGDRMRHEASSILSERST